MFVLNEDNSIYATRGDIVFFTVSAKDDETEKPYHFQPGDVVRIKIYGKKDAESVYLQKDFPVTANSEEVEIYLTEEDTKIGEVISKPKDYWYEVELNPGTSQTFIGYDEDGAKVFKLFPEGADINAYEPDPEDFPVVDEELDMTSPRPVANRVVAAAIARIDRDIKKDTVNPQMFGAVGDGVADDTDALQAMFDTKKKAYIPAGSYKVTNPLTAYNSVYGETGAEIHYYPPESAGHKGCINISGERVLLKEDAACSISGNTMTLADSGLKAGDYVFIHSKEKASAYCRDYDTKQDMLEVESVEGSAITFTSTPEWGNLTAVSLYRMDFIKDIEVANVTIFCEQLSSESSGILISNALNPTVHNCRVSNFDYAQIDVEYAANAHVHDNYCAVNYEDGLQYGIMFGYVYNGTIHGNTVNSERTAIDISFGSQYVTASGNSTRGSINTHWAINCIITGNTINNGFILLRGKKLTVSNNVVNNPNRDTSCITVYEGGAEGDHLIQGNKCYGVMDMIVHMSGVRVLNNTFVATRCPVYQDTENSVLKISSADETEYFDKGCEISGNLIEFVGANAVKYGINMYWNTAHAYNVRICNNVIRNSVNGIYAVLRSTDVGINCTISGNDIQNVVNGIVFRGMNNTVIANNNIKAGIDENEEYIGQYGIQRYYFTATTNGLVIHGNLMNGFAEGLRIQDGGTGVITNAVIANNAYSECEVRTNVNNRLCRSQTIEYPVIVGTDGLRYVLSVANGSVTATQENETW